ncbi:SMI1/KNR4 family protein [Paenibacillus oralis]|uniref:SMI1/KNR4 family protein n=1 Tax=Paenibacillus oralis TaxID=2490856 RepID=A0A3P3U8X1_9BACL|nr:SMI1/KNR4 family protein [Paenibacillus oralis]RRJ66156.1 SMI1/KNR4 family protein [Paenibacillus oralis]
MNWEAVFEVCYRKHAGLSSAEPDRFQAGWHQPLTEREIAEIRENQRNPFPVSNPLHALYRPFDPALWSIPNKPLPADYLDFLRFSNGGEFENGERYFQFFDADEVRSMLLAYEFPEYMPGAVPFAMDGSGNHYIWDMRGDRKNREYPILVASSGNLGYEDAVQIAETFMELCRGTTSAEDVLFG